jgi:hypothetical protein
MTAEWQLRRLDVEIQEKIVKVALKKSFKYCGSEYEEPETIHH